MENILIFFYSQEFTAIASVASVVGALLSIAVLTSINRIKKHYQFTGRIPALSESLAETASNISEQLNLGEVDSIRLHEELGNALIIVRSISRKSYKPLKSDAKNLMRQLKLVEYHRRKSILIYFFRTSYLSDEQYESTIRNIYIDIYKLVAGCNEKYADARWEQ